MALLQISEPGESPLTKENEKCIGIDFGTTNCVCSVVINEKVILIPDEYGSFVIPSVIKIDNQKTLIGNQVFHKNKYEVNELIFSIKRFFTEKPEVKRSFLSHDDQHSPIEIASFIFKYLKNCCDSFLSESISKCVITVPAYFDDRSRSAIKESALIAIVENVQREQLNSIEEAEALYAINGLHESDFVLAAKIDKIF